MIGQIILGGAQMSGFLYGGLKEPLSRKASYAIWDAAWAAGIYFFDTAEGYGASADRLESWLRTRKYIGKAYVSTKVTLGGGVGARIAGAKLRFHGARYVYIMTHGAADAESFSKCKQYIGDLGQSVYKPHEADEASKHSLFLQLPLEAFVSSLRIPCHVRNVFNAGKNISDPPAQLRAALKLLRPGDHLVVGVDSPEHVQTLAEAAT